MALQNDLELALRIRALVEGQEGIVRLGTSFVDLNAKIENLIRGLTAISGSTDGARKEFEYLNDIAQKYGLSILDLSNNYLKLNASSKGTELQGEATRKIFESTSAAMAVLGGDTITAQRAFNALSQMMSKTQIYSEELKGQLAEAIPGALQVMSSALGITTRDMLALMKAGQLSSDALLPFAYELDKRFGKFATTGTTFTQALNRIQNTWTNLMRDFGQKSGIWDALVGTMDALGKSSNILAGALGAGLSVALFKVGVAIKAGIVSLNQLGLSMKIGATSSEQAALANLQQAESLVALARQEAIARAAAVQVAESNLAAATSTRARAIAQAELAAANAAALIATKNEKLAVDALTAAQARMAAATTLASRALAVLGGPVGIVLTAVTGFMLFSSWLGKSSDQMEALKGTTEEYADSLSKMTKQELAQASFLIADQVEKTKALIESERQKVEELKESEKFTRLLGFTTRQNNLYTQERIETEAELSRNIRTLISLEEKQTEVRLALARGAGALISEQNSMTVAMSAAGKAFDTAAAQVKRLQEAQDNGIDVTAELKEQSGLVTAATELWNRSNIRAKEIQEELNISLGGYAKTIGALPANWDAASEAGSKALLQQRDQIANSVKEQVKLNKELDTEKLILENLEKGMLATNELQAQQAKIMGDISRIREADIRVANTGLVVEQQRNVVSERQLAVLENDIRARENSLAQRLRQNNLIGDEKDALEETLTTMRKEADIIRGTIAVTNEKIEIKKLERIQAELAGKTLGEVLDKELAAQTRLRAEIQQVTFERERALGVAGNQKVVAELTQQLTDKQEALKESVQKSTIAMSEGYKTLGIDITGAFDGVDDKTEQTISALERLSLTAKLTGTEIQRAINDSIDLVDTEQEIERLIATLTVMKNEGKLAPEAWSNALSTLKIKLAEVKAELDPTAQALSRLGVGVPEKLRAAATEASFFMDVVERGNVPLATAQAAFLAYAKAAIESANASGEQVPVMIAQRAEALGLGAAYSELLRQLSPLRAEYVATTEAADRSKEVTLDLIESSIAESKANEERAKTQRLLALEQKNAIEVLDALEKERQEGIKTSQLAIRTSEVEEASLRAKIKSLEALEISQGRLNDVEREEIETLRRELAIREQTTAAARQKGEQFKLEQNSVESLRRQYEEMRKVIESSYELDRRRIGIEKQRLENLQKLADATRDESLAKAAAFAVAEKEYQLQQRTISGKKDEIKALEELAKKQKEKLETGEVTNEQYRRNTEEINGNITALSGEVGALQLSSAEALVNVAEKERQIVASRQHAEYLELERQAVLKLQEEQRREQDRLEKKKKYDQAQLKAAGDFVTSILTGWQNRLKQWSEEAEASFKNVVLGVKNTSGEMTKLHAAMERNQTEMTTAIRNLDTGFVRWANTVAIKSLEIERSFLSQAQSAEDMTNSITKATEEGGANLVQMVRAAEAAKQGFNLLDKQRLDNLNAAIDEANNRLKEMQQETEDARVKLAELDAELAQARGDDKRAKILQEELNYQERIKEIEAQRNEAEKVRNTEILGILSEQQSKIEQIHQANLKTIEDEDGKAASLDRTKVKVDDLNSSIERANSGLSAMANTNFSQINSQFDALAGTVKTIHGLL